MSQKKIKKLKQGSRDSILGSRKVLEITNGVWEIVKHNWVFLGILFLGTIAIYINGMAANFVSDDYAAISQNPQIGDFGATVGSGLFIGFSNWFINLLFGNGSPVPYHIYSLIIYLAVCLVLFLLTELLFEDKALSMVTTSLFAVHPVHVEAVTWISGKPYICSALFVTLSLILTFLYFRTANRKYLWVLFFSLVMTFLSDRVRSASYFLLVVPMLFVWRGRFIKKIEWTKVGLALLAGSVLVGLILVPFIINRVNSVNSGYNSSESIFYNPFFQYPTAMAKYLQLLVYPVDLTLYHTMYTFPVWLNWAILIVFLAAIVVAYKWDRAIFFGLIFVFLAAAPSMAPVKVSWLVAERYILFGSYGICLVVSRLLVILLNRSKYIFGAILVGLLVMFSVRVFVRNINWQTNHNLWVNTCQVSPNSHNAWNNIGDDYDKLKDYENAIKGFTQSTIVKPNYADAYHNRANIFFKIGRLDLARDSYYTALKYSPGLFQTYLSLTQISLMEKRGDLAMQEATQATQVQPGNPQAWYVLGVVQSQLGRNDLAMESLKKSLMIAPNYTPSIQAINQLSVALTKP